MAKTYLIPDNFVDAGKVFNGTFKTRNFIEGVILGGFLLLVSFQIPAHSLQARIILSIAMAAPGLMLGIFGINNDPVSVFVYNLFTWQQNRKTMLYNGTAKGRSDDIVKLMMEQKSPQEVLSSQWKALREKNANEEVMLVEGIDFQFEEDPELTKYVQQDSKKGSFFSRRRNASTAEDSLVSIDTLLVEEEE